MVTDRRYGLAAFLLMFLMSSAQVSAAPGGHEQPKVVVAPPAPAVVAPVAPPAPPAPPALTKVEPAVPHIQPAVPAKVVPIPAPQEHKAEVARTPEPKRADVVKAEPIAQPKVVIVPAPQEPKAEVAKIPEPKRADVVKAEPIAQPKVVIVPAPQEHKTEVAKTPEPKDMHVVKPGPDKPVAGHGTGRRSDDKKPVLMPPQTVEHEIFNPGNNEFIPGEGGDKHDFGEAAQPLIGALAGALGTAIQGGQQPNAGQIGAPPQVQTPDQSAVVLPNRTPEKNVAPKAVAGPLPKPLDTQQVPGAKIIPNKDVRKEGHADHVRHVPDEQWYVNHHHRHHHHHHHDHKDHMRPFNNFFDYFYTFIYPVPDLSPVEETYQDNSAPYSEMTEGGSGASFPSVDERMRKASSSGVLTVDAQELIMDTRYAFIASIPDLVLTVRNADDDTLARLVNLTNLKVLNVSEGTITTVPREIANLTNLQVLDLSGNNIATLPDEVGSLKNLAQLILRDNQLTTLPDSIGNLQSLRGLFLGDNKLRKLPPGLLSLKGLKVIELSGNRNLELMKEPNNSWIRSLLAQGTDVRLNDN